MYSNIKNVQILVALLKAYNIKYFVLSPGGSDIPIIHSIETDPDFTCYSVVDERSAVYFAIGISQEKNAPVACVCTSGTAVSNYLPGMTEAFYQDVPIIALTADKEPYRLNQLMLQKIDQNSIFTSVTKKSVELPIIRDGKDRWYCERLINEALIELNHHGTGPVHINIPIIEGGGVYDCEVLPKVKKINLAYEAEQESWKPYIDKLSKAKRILVMVGQNINFDSEDIANIEKFASTYNCVISVEHMANLNCKGCVHTYRLTEYNLPGLYPDLIPDLIISLGNNVASYGLKPIIKANVSAYTHWQIDEAGRIRDFSDRLTDLFECTPKAFFKYFAKNAPKAKNDLEYYNLWKVKHDNVIYPDFEFSNFYVAKNIAGIIPENSILHLAILNSTRTMQYFDLAKGVKTYSNIGALGIDGCMSTFMGQAAASPDKLAYLVVGDLSFFYDMNAAGLRSVGNNVRIVLLNNTGGAEFQLLMGNKLQGINQHICAEHHKVAQGWIESLGYDYHAVRSKEDLQKVLPAFAKKSDKPMFIEVFTDMKKDAELTESFYQQNREQFGGFKMKMAGKAKSMLKPEYIQKAKKFLKK
ncbi:MAG: 2-succinyl-5-enolpyruvyl-6-hydroxy-3-cyclohexene-1-carboxylic-acid synthase [Ruminococcus sp.]|nr:2-succinyl-5-enolpyruvyl-6-hydroxy-3-cyclohexene-1-carboxylic-acid synthase [Ruminococcus sp.]